MDDLLMKSQQENIQGTEVTKSAYGPELPPEMVWKRLFDAFMPQLMAREVPLSLRMPPLESVILSKRSWAIAFDEVAGFQMTFLEDNDLDAREVAVP